MNNKERRDPANAGHSHVNAETATPGKRPRTASLASPVQRKQDPGGDNTGGGHESAALDVASMATSLPHRESIQRSVGQRSVGQRSVGQRSVGQPSHGTSATAVVQRKALGNATQQAVSGATTGSFPHADTLGAETGGAVDADQIPFAWSPQLPAEGASVNGKVAARPGAGIDVMRHEVAHVLGADEATATAAGNNPAVLQSLAQSPQPAQDGLLSFTWDDNTCVELLKLPAAQAYDELDLHRSHKLTVGAFKRLAEANVTLPKVWSIHLPPQLAATFDSIEGPIKQVLPSVEEWIVFNPKTSSFVSDIESGKYDDVDTIDLKNDRQLNANDFTVAVGKVKKSFPKVKNVHLPPGLILDGQDTKAMQLLFPNRAWIAGKENLPEDTLTQHQDSVESWEQRQLLHEEIAHRTMDHVPDKQENLHAIVLMGGPGAGKTSTMNELLGNKGAGYVRVGPDDVKEMLPEYQEAVSARAKNAANMVQQESTVVAHQILEQSVQTKRNLIYDGTGQVKNTYIQMILDLKKAGYKVQVVMVHNRVEEALARTGKRAEETGRFVPKNIIESVYQNVPRNFAEIAAEAEQADLYDNSGKEPVHVWSKDGKKAVVENEDAYERFLDEVQQDDLHVPDEGTRKELQKAEKQRLGTLDASLFMNIAGALQDELDAAPKELVSEVLSIIKDLDKLRKDIIDKKQLPKPVQIRASMGKLLNFIKFCCETGLTHQGQNEGIKLLAAADDATVPKHYLSRYIAAGCEAKKLGMVGDDKKPLTFIHGTHSGTAVLAAKTVCKLMPFGEILKLGIFPVSGELSAGIKMINSTSISGMEMSEAGFKMTAGYATDPRYRFNLLDAQRKGNAERALELIKQSDKLGEVDTAVELQWDHLRIALYRRALMDESFDQKGRDELILLLKQQMGLWAEKGTAVAKAHIGYATDVLETLTTEDNVPDFSKEERTMVELAFPVIFGSSSLKATARPQGVTGELGVAGAAAFGDDVQVAFTKPKYVELLSKVLAQHKVEVTSLDTAYFSFYTQQEG